MCHLQKSVSSSPSSHRSLPWALSSSYLTKVVRLNPGTCRVELKYSGTFDDEIERGVRFGKEVMEEVFDLNVNFNEGENEINKKNTNISFFYFDLYLNHSDLICYLPVGRPTEF